MSIKDNYYTVSQAANELGVTRQSIHRWILSKKLRAERIGRETLIEKGDVVNLKQDIFEGWLDQMVGWYMKRTNFQPLRECFRYTDNDKIEIIGDISDLEYLVTMENGKKEKLIINKHSVGFDKITHQLVGTIDGNDITRVPYEEKRIKRKTKKPRS